MNIHYKKSRGFTVLDLVKWVSVFVASLGSGHCTISYLTLVQMESKVPTVTKQLFSDLSKARNDAVKSNHRVVVCPKQPSVSEEKVCGQSKNWNDGWLVIRVSSKNFSYPYQQDKVKDEIIMQSNVIEGIDVQALLSVNYLEYKPNGTSNQGRRDIFKLCGDKAEMQGRVLSMLQQGKVVMNTAIPECEVKGDA